MSNQNSDGKRAARERLREQRERQRVADKRARGLRIGAVVAGVLALGTLAGVLLVRGDAGGGAAPSAKPVSAGPSNAPATLTVYEDFRCPACAQFENQFRDTVQKLEKEGALRTEYHIVSIIDSAVGGSGSRKAANAALCAEDEGRFAPYHDVLYQNQPEEQDDAFADTGRLLKLAGKVPGLDSARFEKCVTGDRKRERVDSTNDAFRGSDFRGTPTVLLDGEDIYSNQREPLTPERLRELVERRA
ncbi:hypothetical protein E0L36_05555 [Streptomyces sp. AJS327]|uniref:DsbA family protein n=1 Tax=Streptomyces sp. AJS327 TaxID=2545265 RepID=UPI0015DFB500|nr:thioredoxin domain-containing protein [Streptomyces sp. AJS327]MBA0050379.1 hypothetical protein [Streptomyces sp. AJS327]